MEGQQSIQPLPHSQSDTALLTQAYTANSRAFRGGIKPEEMLDVYNEWADEYEDHLQQEHYNGPQILADTICRYFPEKQRRNVRLLDVGAGTGFVGEAMMNRGFTDIDALEPSEEMLKKASQRRVYCNLHCELLGDEETQIPDDAYDAVVCCGVFGEGHIPCSGLYEMIRITKPGGYVCITMRKEYLDTVQEYIGRLEPLMYRLQTDGVWHRRERSQIPWYFMDKEGLVFVFEVLWDGALMVI